jgi:K+-sensing histidine kinase KdpD
VILCGFVVYAAFGLNDVLHVARLIQSIRLFDYAFVAVAVGFTYMLVRRHNRLSTHLEDEVSARTEQLAALERAGRTVMAGLDLDTTLRRIVDEAARMATVARVKLALLDPRTRALAVAAVSGGPAGAALPGPTVESVAVARSGEPLIAPRYLGVPIAAGDEVLGVLAFDHAGPHDYSLQDLAVLRSFADQAAIAIVNARIYAAEGAARREAEEALAQVKQLQGMLPICAWCKRVRNDRNYWEQIEVYVSERTDARFTHGICPDCRAKVRPRPAGTA